MHNLPAHDGDRKIDWGLKSRDYADWRPDYPIEFYDRLSEAGIGVPDQRILDLGTGVGFLALEFARRGAIVTAADISAGQIEQARRTAAARHFAVDFRVAPAEQTGLPDGTFAAITASQSWLYFDRERMLSEVPRLLTASGVLMLSHFCWLPRLDDIARRSEQLVLEHNPDWTAADWDGVVPDFPEWAEGHFQKVGGFVFDTPVRFTRERWRGRMRACRGVGAALSPDDVRRFDEAHALLLERTVPEEFDVVHRVDCMLLQPIR